MSVRAPAVQRRSRGRLRAGVDDPAAPGRHGAAAAAAAAAGAQGA